MCLGHIIVSIQMAIKVKRIKLDMDGLEMTHYVLRTKSALITPRPIVSQLDAI